MTFVFTTGFNFLWAADKKNKQTNMEIWGYSRLSLIRPLLIWNLEELEMTALLEYSAYNCMRVLYINVWGLVIWTIHLSEHLKLSENKGVWITEGILYFEKKIKTLTKLLPWRTILLCQP